MWWRILRLGRLVGNLVHSSQFTVHSAKYTVHSAQYTVHRFLMRDEGAPINYIHYLLPIP